MLSERYSLSFLKKHLLPKSIWAPFPPAKNRAAWKKLLRYPLNRKRLAFLRRAAANLAPQPCPPLPATLYMEFVRNGNRSRYETPYFERRQRLSVLVVAECMEHKGRFLDPVINYLWAILEEISWCLPAHAHKSAPGDVLPSEKTETVDLFAAETAFIMAEALYLLRAELESVSPSLCQRIDQEIMRRVIQPVEREQEIGWRNGRNNWTPWCASSVLAAAMYIMDDTDRLARLSKQLMTYVDRFLSRYGKDGGCDEGSGYWSVAAGAMLIFLEFLYSRTNGAVNIYDEPLIKKMGEFIVHMHIHRNWFVNFADASARTALRNAGMRESVPYRYGERVGSNAMKDLALLSMREWKQTGAVHPPFNSLRLMNMMRSLCWVPALARPGSLRQSKSIWYQDLQVLVARSSNNSGKGFVLAAKAGHNDENHNHNDVGQFILFFNGEPLIVDVGVETYTRKTFSKDRYTLWSMRSSGHNVPMVNGMEQEPGLSHRATNVSFKRKGSLQKLGMNLELAYPQNAHILSLRREFLFDGGSRPSVTIKDTFERSVSQSEIILPIFTPGRVLIRKKHVLISCGKWMIQIQYQPESIKVESGIKRIEDAKLQYSWGKRLNYIRFIYRSASKIGQYSLRISSAG